MIEKWERVVMMRQRLRKKHQSKMYRKRKYPLKVAIRMFYLFAVVAVAQKDLIVIISEYTR